MLANMASSLILHKRIKTTTAKAKALRKFVEPLLTKSKGDTMHARRVVFSYLKNKEVVTELFNEVANKISNRPGGYTRIIKTGYRLGDNADMCIIELVDYNELLQTSTTPGGGRKRRRSRKKSASSQDTPQTPTENQVSTAEDLNTDAEQADAQIPAAESENPENQATQTPENQADHETTQEEKDSDKPSEEEKN